MDWIIKKIQSDKRKTALFANLVKKNDFEWQKFANTEDIFKWLQNFRDDDEIYLALILANNIMYFTDKRMEYLWEIILSNRVKQYLLETLFEKEWPDDIDRWFEEYLKEKCIFIGYGKASKTDNQWYLHLSKAMV